MRSSRVDLILAFNLVLRNACTGLSLMIMMLGGWRSPILTSPFGWSLALRVNAYAAVFSYVLVTSSYRFSVRFCGGI